MASTVTIEDIHIMRRFLVIVQIAVEDVTNKSNDKEFITDLNSSILIFQV